MSESVLERSVLERKERDELQSIARAMGVQPPARTKKADLVDLILQTAGVIPAGTQGGGANGTQAPPGPVSRRRSTRANGAEQPSNGSAPDGAGATTEADAREEAATGTEAAGGGDGAEVAPEARPGDGDSESSGSRSGDGSEQRRGDHDRTNDRTNDRSAGTAGSGGGAGSDGDRGRGRSDGDTSEGNRRRRRRGRDRGSEPRAEETYTGEPVACSGLLDLRDEGYGFLRTKGYLASKDDIYVSVKQVRQFGLRKGDHLTGASRPANRSEKNPALLRVDQVNGKDPEEAKRRPRFEDLTPLFPDEVLRLETPSDPTNMTARIVDLVSPIGKGQRGLIVSPPKAGKTTIMKQIVKSIEANNPDVHLMVLLVDERPEEVTDMRRHTKGEVIASTFDRPSDEHTQVTELGIERAKRLVEEGTDVVIVLDGITRLARAYNLAAPATGRIMSGGIDTGALYPPKKFFGAARNIEEGGSLTILATALIETGSKMDEVIFEEFKGTGNMELRLDRRLAERRIYPAIDVDASSTRHEELLFDRKQLQQVWRVRRALNALSADGASPSAALERLMDGMRTFASNEAFLAEAAKAGGPAA
ncbi:MAG TPA: transcription termination factor Rho [Acidimicrobiales bacterium]|nr:transcription termination factor Rho [Acidimicrobiales bacterium]